MLEFQKNYSVKKAAEVLRLLERMASKEGNYNIQLIKKTIIRNLATRNKGLEPDEKYWSMQLLIKLGLIPDPAGSKRKKLEISPNDRKKQLEELGIDIP